MPADLEYKRVPSNESRRLEHIVPAVAKSSGFRFGQKTELTWTIHRLIRECPEGVGILKELVQNADDAERVAGIPTPCSGAVHWIARIGRSSCSSHF